MTQIILTPEQSALLERADATVFVVDARGRQFTLNPAPAGWNAAEIAEMEAWIDSGEKGVSFEQVMCRIRAQEQSSCDTP